MRVTVVVPVYNPGHHIEPLIDSLAAQTLPPEEFEAIFVDDGSTDETPDRLDRLAAERANVRVIHQENSGWPGKPRNVGIEAAQGEYVFFSDHDDWFGPEALAGMDAMARRTGADIVIGKMVGHNRGVPRVLFRRSVDRATLATTPLMDSLTPHKLFRKAFLDTHALRFPEGKRRLEDHVFVVRAYFRAGVISVLADPVCYHHSRREDSSNAGYTDIDPVSYYGYVRETLDVIDEHTRPGALRDRLLRRFLRQEILGRLDGPGFLDADPDYRRTLFEEIRALISERFPVTVDAGLPGRQRLLSGAARAGGPEDAVRLAEWSSGVRTEPRLLAVGWAEDTLALNWELRLAAPTGPLLTVEKSRLVLQLPPGSALGIPVDVTDELRRVRIDLVARLRDVGDDLLLPTEFDAGVDDTGALHVTGRSALAPELASFGSPMSGGTWDLWIRLAAFGWSADRRLGPARTPAATAGCRAAFLGEPARVALPYFTEPHGHLSLALDGPVPSLEPALRPRRGGVAARVEAQRLRIRLRLPVRSFSTGSAQVRLQRRSGADYVEMPARLEPTDDGSTLMISPIPLRGPGAQPPGRFALLLRLRDTAEAAGLGVEVRIARNGRARLRRSDRRARWRRVTSRYARRLRRVAGRLARRTGRWPRTGR